MNVIHTAGPMEHASHMAAQPQFVHPERHAFVDLSGHNLASPHPFAGRAMGKKQGRLGQVRGGGGTPARLPPRAWPRVRTATAGLPLLLCAAREGLEPHRAGSGRPWA